MLTILINTINRPQLLLKTLKNNLARCGITDFVLFISNNGGGDVAQRAIDSLPFDRTLYRHHENIGNAASMNLMIRDVATKYVAIISDDIMLPENWAKQAIAVNEKIGDKAGLIGFNWRGVLPDKYNKQYDIYETGTVFGCILFSSHLIDEHGYFMEFSKYGIWDAEFSNRIHSAGKINGYLAGFPSVHLGGDTHLTTDYRLMKNSELSRAKRNYTRYLKNNPGKLKVEWEERQLYLD